MNRVDFSATKAPIDGALIRFVAGIRGARSEAVSMAQIQKWFGGTPSDFVTRSVDSLVAAGKLEIVRTGLRKRCAYRYEVAARG